MVWSWRQKLLRVAAKLAAENAIDISPRYWPLMLLRQRIIVTTGRLHHSGLRTMIPQLWQKGVGDVVDTSLRASALMWRR